MFLANKFKIFITFTSPRVDGMLFSFRCCLYNLQLAKIVRPVFSFIKISDRDLKFVYLFYQTDTFLFVIETLMLNVIVNIL
jgi:hypothetical protein